jgi:hypothetical protein
VVQEEGRDSSGSVIEQLVLAVLKFIEYLLRKDQTSEDAKRDPGLRDKLLDRIRQHEQRMRDAGDTGAKR